MIEGTLLRQLANVSLRIASRNRITSISAHCLIKKPTLIVAQPGAGLPIPKTVMPTWLKLGLGGCTQELQNMAERAKALKEKFGLQTLFLNTMSSALQKQAAIDKGISEETNFISDQDEELAKAWGISLVPVEDLRLPVKAVYPPQSMLFDAAGRCKMLFPGRITEEAAYHSLTKYLETNKVC